VVPSLGDHLPLDACDGIRTFHCQASAYDQDQQDAKDPHSSVGLSSRCWGLWSECVFDNMANLWTCDIPISYLNEHSGLSGAIAVLWYAVDTVQKYRLEVSLGIPGVTYELGYSYWMAAAGTICICVTGILLIVANFPRIRTPRRGRNQPRACLPSVSQRKGTYL
ncbi:hypothetical protein KIL84_022215, partial [Mauremys mutica]